MPTFDLIKYSNMYCNLFVTHSSWSCHDQEGRLRCVAAFVEDGRGPATRGAFDDRDGHVGAVLRRRDAQHDGARGEGRRPGLPGQERPRIQGSQRFKLEIFISAVCCENREGSPPLHRPSCISFAFRSSSEVTSLPRATATLPLPRARAPPCQPSLCLSVCPSVRLK